MSLEEEHIRELQRQLQIALQRQGLQGLMQAQVRQQPLQGLQGLAQQQQQAMMQLSGQGLFPPNHFNRPFSGVHGFIKGVSGDEPEEAKRTIQRMPPEEPKEDVRLILKQCDTCIFYKENNLDRTMAGCTKNEEFADINRLTSFCGKDGIFFELNKDS